MNLLKVDGKIKYSELIPCVLIPLLVGVLSSTLSISSIKAYGPVVMPKYSLPVYLFPVIWAASYFLMGIAAYRAKLNGMMFKDKGSISYSLSLAANCLWPLLFFKLNSPIVALFDAIILTILAALTFFEYKKIDKAAAYLLLPYVLWLIYASILNTLFVKI